MRDAARCLRIRRYRAVVRSRRSLPVPVRAPLILTDFSCTPFDPADLAATAAVLAPSCDAVLVGEHQNRPDFPPTLMGRLLLDSGVSPWITLSCRDRNRVVLEQELRGLKLIGVQTVFCVTGDGRGYDVRPDVTQTFDLDGPRLVALAASLGMASRLYPRRRPHPPSTPGRVASSRSSARARALRCSTTCRPPRRWRST